MQNKFKKTEERVSQLENHSAAICQVYKEQDLTRGKQKLLLCVELKMRIDCSLQIFLSRLYRAWDGALYEEGGSCSLCSM